MTKKIISSSKDKEGLLYEVYDDGTAIVRCKECGIMDEVKKDAPAKEGMFNNWSCLKCWNKKQEEKEKQNKQERQESISKGQAFNLAVSMAIEIYGKNKIKSEEEFIKLVKKWYEVFVKIIKDIQGNGR